MKSFVIKKWVEPYVLLETLKKQYNMTDLTFDGFSKDIEKNKMYKFIDNGNGKAFGLYMKNVNKFYCFSSEDMVDIGAVLNDIDISSADCEDFEDREVPISYIDTARAEAAIIV